MHIQFDGFFSKLSCAGDAKVHVANRMHCERTYPVLESYLPLLNDSYESTIQSVNLRNCESARKLVNAWVERATGTKNKYILRSGSLHALAKLYFQILWKSHFSARATRRSDFHIDANNKKQVHMMYQKDDDQLR